MAGGKETPRQKMIGMMYLVLTALLALNVSKEIINAFVKLDDKLMESNKILLQKGDAVMAEFDRMMALPQNKAIVKPWQEKAVKLRQMAFEMDQFIQLDCKNKLLKEVEKKDYITANEKERRFKTLPLMEVQTKDDYDAATRLFGGEQGSEGFKFGAQIREKMMKYRDDVLAFVTDYEGVGDDGKTKKFKFNGANVKDSASLEKELLTNVYPGDRDRVRSIYNSLSIPEKIKDHETEVAWQLGTFDHAPVVAAAALFTALSNDVRNAEAQALEIIQSRVKVPTFNFNKIEPLAFARTSYLNVGDSLDLRVMIAAYDSTEVVKLKFGVNDSNPANWQDATGRIPLRGGSPGEYNVYGQIAIKEKGVEKWRPWRYRYEVGEPVGVISNEDLTVIYAGYEHTFSASASGYPQERVNLVLPGITVGKKGGGKFSVKATPGMVGKKVESSISVKTDEGGSKSFKGPVFVVKQLPKPSSYLGGIASEESSISLSQLKSNVNAGVRVAYDPSVPLDPTKVRFTVTGFEMVVTVGGNTVRKSSSSGRLTPEMTSLIGALKPGMSISFTSIKATGPAGAIRVSPLAFVLK